jgi:DNA recombination protein RmuC
MLGLVAILLVLLAALAAGAIFLPRLLRGELGALQERTASELSARNAEFELRLQGLEQTLNTRLAATTQSTTQIHDRLGQMTQATAEMIERAKELGKLEQALRPPKARGGFGELLLENLLRDRLPPDAYDLQYTFDSGERVDAVIRAGGRLLPVDAKFPLDNFERMTASGGDEQQLHERAFARDVKGHIDAIASKYIRPELGTFDFAFMYLPAEAIHYELVSGKEHSAPARPSQQEVIAVIFVGVVLVLERHELV